MTEPTAPRRSPLRQFRSARSFGIRARIVIATAALLAAAFVVAIVIVRQMLVIRVDDAIELDLAQEIDELRALAADTATTIDGVTTRDDVAQLFTIFLQRNVPADDEAFYTFVDGRPQLASFDAPRSVFDDPAIVARWTAATLPLREDIVIDGSELHVLSTPVLGASGEVLGTFVVAIDANDDRSDVTDVVRTLAFVALLVLVGGVGAAWSIANRVVRPVRDLTAAARSTAASDLRRRIDVSGTDELAELGQTYNEMLDRLETSFREQRAFLDDVAHELRTPITIVRGNLELLSDDATERAAAVALMTDELDRMTRYVDDLLLVARSRRPDFLRTELVDVADIVDGVLQRSVSMAQRDWVRGKAPATGQLLTEADPERVVQALLALVTNAVQHTTDGDRITVGADLRPVAPDSPHAAVDTHRTGTHEIVLWVADSGPGIADADPERLFDRFSRGPASSSARPEGTGLGLAIVAAIAAAHGGRASVESHPASRPDGSVGSHLDAASAPTVPSGSTFRIHLPHALLEDQA